MISCIASNSKSICNKCGLIEKETVTACDFCGVEIDRRSDHLPSKMIYDSDGYLIGYDAPCDDVGFIPDPCLDFNFCSKCYAFYCGICYFLHCGDANGDNDTIIEGLLREEIPVEGLGL